MLLLHNESYSAVKHPGIVHDCIRHKWISAIIKKEKKPDNLGEISKFWNANLFSLYSCNTLILVHELDPNPSHSKKIYKKASVPHTPYWPGSAYAASACMEKKTPEGTLLRGPASLIQVQVGHLHLTGFLMVGTHRQKKLQLPLPSKKERQVLDTWTESKEARSRRRRNGLKCFAVFLPILSFLYGISCTYAVITPHLIFLQQCEPKTLLYWRLHCLHIRDTHTWLSIAAPVLLVDLTPPSFWFNRARTWCTFCHLDSYQNTKPEIGWKKLAAEIVIHFCSPDPEIKTTEHMTTLHLREWWVACLWNQVIYPVTNFVMVFWGRGLISVSSSLRKYLFIK